MRIDYSGIADAELPKALPAERYDLRISQATFNEKSKSSGKPNIEVEIEFLANPSAKAIYHYIVFPDGENSKKDATKRGMTKAFVELFGIEFDEAGLDTDDFAGKTADNVPVSYEKDDQGRESNRIDLFNL